MSGVVDVVSVVGPFQCNCHVIICPETRHTALIDPGDEPGKILELLRKQEAKLGGPLAVTHLFHTHAHLDHIGATARLKRAFPEAKICLHAGDTAIYQSLKAQGEMFGLRLEDPSPVDQFIEDGEEVHVGRLRFKFLHTPGHSPGGLCLCLNDTVYSGDTLFQGSIGRTDLWEGDFRILEKSIKERLYVLDPDTRVAPGHGPDTKIGIEKRQNPFVQA